MKLLNGKKYFILLGEGEEVEVPEKKVVAVERALIYTMLRLRTILNRTDVVAGRTTQTSRTRIFFYRLRGQHFWKRRKSSNIMPLEN